MNIDGVPVYPDAQDFWHFLLEGRDQVQLAQGRRTGILGLMGCIHKGRAPIGHDRIANEFVDHTVGFLDWDGHIFQIHIQKRDQGVW